MNLIGLFVHLLDLHLTEHVNGQLVLNESLIQERVILHLSRSQKPYHQDQIVRDIRIPEYFQHIFCAFNVRIIQLLEEELLHILENDSLEFGFD